VAQLRAALLEEITEEDMRTILRAVIERAKEGDLQAAKLVFSYTVGKPRGAEAEREPMPSVGEVEGAGLGAEEKANPQPRIDLTPVGMPMPFDSPQGAPSTNDVLDSLRGRPLLPPSAKGKHGCREKGKP
jgi:hypothetical protein